MTEFEFNCMTHANRLMAQAKRRHECDVAGARIRPVCRAAARAYRKVRQEKRLNNVLLIASLIGIAVAIWFLTAIVAH